MHRPGGRKLVVVVKPGAQTGTVLAWLRRLLPAAMLLVAPAAPPPSCDVIAIDADAVVSSPLALADALARHAGDAKAK
jgi:predicted phosphoribosyltransferase